MARVEAGLGPIRAESWRGSQGVWDPNGELIPGYKNKDRFLNCKAQSWWWLRMKFEATYKAVVLGLPFDADMVISIPSDLPERNELLNELGQPTFAENAVGKYTVDKMSGGRSPDRADSLMIAFAPGDYIHADRMAKFGQALVGSGWAGRLEPQM